MQVFTQLVLIVGRIAPEGVQMLGTGFLVAPDGRVVTTRHVAGNDESNLVVLVPHVKDLNVFQDLSDTGCQTVKAVIAEIDPLRDLTVLRTDLKFSGNLPKLGDFDDDNVGDEVTIFGFPHCVNGRRALTYQKTEIGAKVLLGEKGVTSKHAVINTQARPGQSGSMIFSPKNQTVSGVLIGAWAPGAGGISLGGINPQELHQTTHCVSAEYIREML